MVRSALKLALAAEKGKDPREKKNKRILKEKQQAKLTKKDRGIQEVDTDGDEDEEDSDAETGGVSLQRSEDADEEMVDDDDGDGDDDEDDQKGRDVLLDIEAIDDTESDSESDIEMEEKIIRPKNDPPKRKDALALKKGKVVNEEEEEDADEDREEEEEEEEEDVALSDIEDEEDREDVVPHTRLIINNKTALLASLNRIRIDTSSAVPFASHQSLSSSKPTEEAIPNVSDDLQRELAFLSQSLEAARKGRSLLVKEGVPFTRPGDYFAEMVKDDGQMQKVQAKLVEEATAKKAAAEARKLRDLKKFGKQVQIAKLQERQKAKRETLEKIKTLKKKRQENGSNDVGTTEGDLFDVAVDEELKGYGSKSKSSSSRAGSGRGGMEPNAKRQKKNEKYGFGGKKRHAKSGDAFSSGDVSGFNNRRGSGGIAKGRITKTKPLRPGKNRRKAMAGR